MSPSSPASGSPPAPSKVIGAPTKAWKDWHQAFDKLFAGDVDGANRVLDDLFDERILFKPPTYFKERRGRDFAKQALLGVSTLFKDFRYVREFVSDQDLALEFVCRAGDDGPWMHGIDLMRIDPVTNKVVEFAVLARPPNAVKILLEHQNKFMAPFLAKMQAAAGKAKPKL